VGPGGGMGLLPCGVSGGLLPVKADQSLLCRAVGH
jgi:hypothetical protein